MPKSSNTFTGGRSPRRKSSNRRSGSGSAVGIGRLLLGVGIGVVLSLGCTVLYFYSGRAPVAVSDKPALWEHLAETTAVHRRITSEVKPPPFPASEDVFEAAAHNYREQCAMCHGLPGHDAPIGRQMLPHAAQFFTRDRRAISTKAVGELFWPIAFGVRRTGMPAYNHTLSNTQLWQLALLLHGTGDELPDPVSRILAEQQTAPQGMQVVVPIRSGTQNPSAGIGASHLAPMARPESRF